MKIVDRLGDVGNNPAIIILDSQEGIGDIPSVITIDSEKAWEVVQMCTWGKRRAFCRQKRRALEVVQV